MREAAEHEANERRRADPPEARKGNASPQPYHQHREQLIDAAQRMKQTGGKDRQSDVAGMVRYRRHEAGQRTHRPTTRAITGRYSFANRSPPVALMTWRKSDTRVPARPIAQ